MYWLIVGLGLLSVIGIVYVVRYELLKKSLKSASEQMREIGQNPEDNRILLVAHTNRFAEDFLATFNDYIRQTQLIRIQKENREKRLRRQIEAVSHDFRTPLTAILGYLELMERDELGEENREALDIAQNKAKRLQSMIENFYDLSRLELEDYHLQPDSLELGRFVRERMLEAYSSLEQRRLEVIMDCGENIYVNADPGAMDRIINNLLQNVLRYAESRLKVSLQKTGEGKAALTFENDTYAVREEDVEHLFELFYMSDAARSGRGTGLGLTICKLLVEAMGGDARAEFENHMLRIILMFPVLEKK